MVDNDVLYNLIAYESTHFTFDYVISIVLRYEMMIHSMLLMMAILLCDHICSPSLSVISV